MPHAKDIPLNAAVIYRNRRGIVVGGVWEWADVWDVEIVGNAAPSS